MAGQRVAVIYGPTGIGKTSLSIEIAKEIGAEIISADSMAVYRGMDVGTAKPSLEERQGVAHHLIDVVEPQEPFSAKTFSELARAALLDCARREVPALVVGGTGLYIRALVHGLFEGPEADENLRQNLQKLEGETPGYLHSRLAIADPASAERLHPNDHLRLIRALEVFELTGKPLTFWIEQHRFQERPFNALKIGMIDEREALYSRIDQRVDEMINLGLKLEVHGLLEGGCSRELRSMKALGYQHMTYHLLDGMPLAEMLRLLKRDHRRFSRRQMTWMRGEQELVQMHCRERDAIKGRIINFLKP